MDLLGIGLLIAAVSCAQHTAEQEADTAQLTAADSSTIIAHTYETLYRDPEDRTRFFMRQLRRLVSEHRGATGELPAELGDVLDLSLEPHDRQMALSDAWGSPLRYSQDGDTLELLSAGPDQVIGTTDDLIERWAP